jgi:tRNA (guanine37-N1)-methyltransferase
MKFSVITLFPRLVELPLAESMVAKAQAAGLVKIEIKDLRDFCEGKHRVADDAPFGGGGGMVLKAEPLIRAVQALKQADPAAKVIYLGPQGTKLDQAKVMDCASEKSFILICGHYEGVDQRALDAVVDEEISIGDYVLTGGELAACVLIDAVTRQLPGVLGDENSAKNDSFYNGLLDYPHYTRPASLPEGEVPAVLLGGDHEATARWRREQSLLATLKRRPDLLETAPLTDKDREFLKQQKRGER